MIRSRCGHFYTADRQRKKPMACASPRSEINSDSGG